MVVRYLRGIAPPAASHFTELSRAAHDAVSLKTGPEMQRHDADQPQPATALSAIGLIRAAAILACVTAS